MGGSNECRCCRSSVLYLRSSRGGGGGCGVTYAILVFGMDLISWLEYMPSTQIVNVRTNKNHKIPKTMRDVVKIACRMM